jgi:serine/threonine-protein kinase
MQISPQTWPALSALLDEALALPVQERATWVESLQGEHAALKDTLRDLLSRAAGVETEDFLATLPRFTRLAPADLRGPLTELAAGESIGPYRLISELGTGGMGAVWLAERSDGQLKRKVALKLPRLVWAKGLAERMARERDILATLEHPNIARLYDAGVDQHGRPYLALEYIEGQPIDVYARERGLGVKDKLQLLLQVCSAVAFAHSRLVVHRDLKPSNILVTPDGQVRLLDFGIAKLMEGDSAKETQLTQLAGRALTLDYASPEQIKGEPIGTASDVYSLGVVAYELLTGAKPYRLKRGSAAELEEAIATADASRASEAAAEPLAKKELRGDLDAILNKALKKTTVDRYATIDALAQDIKRHLNSEPVSAQPDSLGYRAAKFLARHRGRAAAAGVALFALAGGLTLALWQSREAQRQRDLALLAAEQSARDAARADREAARADEGRREADLAAEQARVAAAEARDLALEQQRVAAQAQRESARAAAVQAFLVDIFRSNSARQSDPNAARNVTARELLDKGAERLPRTLEDQPAARQELAFTLATLYRELGLTDKSYELSRVAEQEAVRVHGKGSGPHLLAMTQLLTLYNEGASGAAGAVQGRQLAEEAARLVPVGQRPTRERVELLRALALFNEGRDLASAERFAERALTEARSASQPHEVAATLVMRGRIASAKGDLAGAEGLIREGIELGEGAAGARDYDYIIPRAMLAQVQAQRLRLPEAVANFEAALATAQRLNGPEHLDAIQLRFRLGSVLLAAGRLDEAQTQLQAAREAASRGADRELLLSSIHYDMGLLEREAGRYQRSAQLLSQALEVRERLRPGTAQAASIREELALTQGHLGNFDTADALLAEAKALRLAQGMKPGDSLWNRQVGLQLAVLRLRGDQDRIAAVLPQLTAGSLDSRTPTRSWLVAVLLRASLALDVGADAEASRFLQAVSRSIKDLDLDRRYPYLEARYYLQCGRLAKRADHPGAAEGHFQRVDTVLALGYTPDGPLARELAAARREGPVAAQSVRSCQL